MAQEREKLLKEYDSPFLREFRVQRELGYGTFGRVYEAVKDGYSFAVKIIPVGTRGSKDLINAMREVKNMEILDHVHIVKYMKSWLEKPSTMWQYNANSFILNEMGLTEEQKMSKMHEMSIKDGAKFLYIQMEMCNYSLKDWLEKNKKRSLNQMHRWFKQIVLALEYLHSEDIDLIHRDLKPSNILFSGSDHLKICDLGTATEIARQDGQEVARTRTNFVGTDLYWAPEQEENHVKQVYNSKVDIFSSGLILHEMCIPMEEAEREMIFDNYRRGNQDILTDQPPLNELIRLLTNTNTDDRPACKAILEHRFLKCFNDLNLSEHAAKKEHVASGNMQRPQISEARGETTHAADDRSNASSQSSRVSCNDYDFDVLKKTIWLEARGESQEGKVAVAHVILNRVRANRGYFGGNTIAGVCLHPGQFGAWNSSNPGSTNPFGDGWESMDGWVNAVLDGRIPDPTNGALYFNNPDKERKPDWTNNVKIGIKIGNHQFYNDL